MRNMGIGNFRQIIFVFCLFINALELVAQSNPSIDALGDGSQKIISDTAHHQTASLLKMKTKWEFSTNVTLALSRFTGNVSRNLNDDPYLIMVRKIDVDQGAAWRLGVNGFRTNSQSNFPDRVSSENWASLVIGREWRSELQQGLLFTVVSIPVEYFVNHTVRLPNLTTWASAYFQLLMPKNMVEVLEEFVGLVGDFKIE